MACSLIEHKRINTTVAKAKALRGYVEPLITKSKNDTTHSRRTVFGYLQNKEAVSELFREIAPKVADRPGGYTRIIRTGYRLGDNAEMCMIELVDFNELYSNEGKKKTTRRSRRGGGGAKAAAGDVTAEATEAVEEVEATEATAEEAKDATTEVEAPAEEATPEAEAKEEAPTETEEPKAEADSADEASEDKADDAEEKK